jgi:hypothetical protein
MRPNALAEELGHEDVKKEESQICGEARVGCERTGVRVMPAGLPRPRRSSL